jgi:guanylate kinase
MMVKKIAISGKMVSGKTTLLNAITAQNPTLVKVSLADPVKEVAYRYFKMPKEEKDRSLLQKIGQQFRLINPMVWIQLLNDTADNHAKEGLGSICDDVRFPNEIESMKDNDWLTIRLEVNEAERLKRVKNTYGANWENHWENRFEESETSLDNYDFEWDYVFTDMLYENIETVAKEICELINSESS